jgi:hypothetical protein
MVPVSMGVHVSGKVWLGGGWVSNASVVFVCLVAGVLVVSAGQGPDFRCAAPPPPHTHTHHRSRRRDKMRERMLRAQQAAGGGEPPSS